jgi:hypothetical protein
MKPEFCRQIFEKYSDIKFLESCLVGAESFHVDSQMDGWMDGQVDMTKLIVTCCNFADLSKKLCQRNTYNIFLSNAAMYKTTCHHIPVECNVVTTVTA